MRSCAEQVPIERIGTPEFQALLVRMIDAMREASGVGLAAPQLGVPLQVMVVEDRDSSLASVPPAELAERERGPVPLKVFINPVLTPIGDEKVTFFEGCLSVSGFAALVERWREVEITGLDEHGLTQTWRVRGWPARILQHEVDHLNGTLYIDRMKPRSFSAMGQMRKRFAGLSTSEIHALLDVDRH